MSYVRVLNGLFDGNLVNNVVFPLIKPFNVGANGGYITVYGTYYGHHRNIRIKLNSMLDYTGASDEDYTNQPLRGNMNLHGNNAMDTTAVVPAAPVETDEEVIARIRDRFSMLDDMTQAVVEGNIRAMIVSGPPGVGKSFGVEKIIEKSVLFDQIAGRKISAEIVKGSVTAAALYMLLYKNSDSNSVIVFDDIDVIFTDDVALNLLKGALDSGKRRKISWLADSHTLRKEGIPDSFDFKGSVIFISNIKFENSKGKIAEHLAALQSRCHYLDLTMDTMRDKILRVKQIHNDGGLFDDLGLTEEQGNEVIDFMGENAGGLREVSLRMAVKIGQLRKGFDAKWQQMAKATCMR